MARYTRSLRHGSAGDIEGYAHREHRSAKGRVRRYKFQRETRLMREEREARRQKKREKFSR